MSTISLLKIPKPWCWLTISCCSQTCLTSWKELHSRKNSEYLLTATGASYGHQQQHVGPGVQVFQSPGAVKADEEFQRLATLADHKFVELGIPPQIIQLNHDVGICSWQYKKVEPKEQQDLRLPMLRWYAAGLHSRMHCHMWVKLTHLLCCWLWQGTFSNRKSASSENGILTLRTLISASGRMMAAGQRRTSNTSSSSHRLYNSVVNNFALSILKIDVFIRFVSTAMTKR